MPQKRYCDITGLEVRYLHPVDCSQMGKYRVGKEVPFRAPLAELAASLSLSATPCQACWRSFSNDSQASAHNQLTWLPHGPSLLQAKYTDPKSTLRYHNPEVYDILRTFQPAVIQAYLAVRGQGVVLR